MENNKFLKDMEEVKRITSEKVTTLSSHQEQFADSREAAEARLNSERKNLDQRLEEKQKTLEAFKERLVSVKEKLEAQINARSALE